MIDKSFKEAIGKLEENIKYVLSRIDEKEQDKIQEIRIRKNKELMVNIYSNNYYVNREGIINKRSDEKKYIVSEEEINKSFNRICEYSLYTYQDQINKGFITLKGGHRVGICGTAILKNGVITNIKNITSMNIRISRRIFNVADKFIKETMNEGLNSVLICGRPGSGKTTLLKDIIRQISCGKIGKLYNISVIDERGEISGGSDVGYLSLGTGVDLFDGYLKPEGMMIAIRTMAPDLIVCDEIGTEEETKAIEAALNSGVKIIATMHAGSEEEVYLKPQIKRLIELRVFNKIVILGLDGTPCFINKVISLI